MRVDVVLCSQVLFFSLYKIKTYGIPAHVWRIFLALRYQEKCSVFNITATFEYIRLFLSGSQQDEGLKNILIDFFSERASTVAASTGCLLPTNLGLITSKGSSGQF